MQLLRPTGRSALALLAVLVMLTACSHGSAAGSAGRGGRPRPEAARERSDPVRALRPGLTRPSGGPAYYLSLGDSLARGVQPTSFGYEVATDRGYPDRLAVLLRRHLKRLRLVKMGCSGETTATMIRGGRCRYPAGSQLAQAARFLRAHRGRVALITIDIGANDPNSCVLGGGLGSILPCVLARLPQISKNLDRILPTLRKAAGRRVLIVGMTYYVPELGLWKRGTAGRQIGILTGAVAAGANTMLTDRYREHGARVANVFAAFRTADFGVKKRRVRGSLPPNVAAICSLTWMCASPPRGPDEHANDAGYRLIARTFWRTIAAAP
jgi:lysophospholipase L1-like esterase